MRFKVIGVIVFAVLAKLVAPSFGDELAVTGRQIAQKWQNCMVRVQFVIRTTYSYEGKDSPSEEQKQEVDACVIDSSGLLVTSLARMNPDALFGEMAQEDSKDFKMSSEVTDAKIILPDGQEMPAKIVLRDKDLDLAFIRPLQKPAVPLTAVDLSKASKPEILDPVVCLSRQTVVGNRVIAVSLHRIASIVDKPRLHYVPDGEPEMGSLVLSLDGNVVGLSVVKRLPKGSGSASAWENIMQVILPAKDIAEAAKQAPAEAR